MNANEAMGTLQGWVRAAMSLGVSLIGLFLVVEVLYPGDSGVHVIKGIGDVVAQFSGLNGLIALLVLAALVLPSSRT
ncbi:MAG: hypothetical protein HRU14_13135 [Planctomycetes bacterium]|nr:hypothetical protein [Planctomycetota bacterium]